MANRLATESSPYLLQHRDNPVDWYPFGQEAFERARAEDKPVFVSIGYAACHWCHVMAHECFEDPLIAKLMNELFVNVKVDREERPDVDSVYMAAIHIMGEGGGWPLSAFCDSDGKPFFIGTYFPPRERRGIPGFSTVLQRMAAAFRDERAKVDENTEGVLEGMQRMDEHLRRTALASKGSAALDSLLVTAGRALAERSDKHNGGLGSEPKFPSTSAHDLLGRCSRQKFGDPARAAFLLQCENMAAGGICDHLGGGFARYSVDKHWHVPHFEKMLYDNAQLLSVYGDAYVMTGKSRFREVIAETTEWLAREMSDPAGGLFASQDADSEGVEGKFYVWTAEQVEATLGPAAAIQFKANYDVTTTGNWEGVTVLRRVTSRGSDAEESALGDMRRALFEARDQRIRPDTDTKVLAGWNGLAIVGLVRAWEATGNDDCLRLAVRVAEFLRDHMIDGTRIARVWKDGAVKLDGTIDDYAFVGFAMLRVAEATLKPEWWSVGHELLSAVADRFYSDEGGTGVFFMTASDDPEPLIYRPRSYQDGALPAGASVAVRGFLRLARVAGDLRLGAIADAYIAARGEPAKDNVFGAAHLFAAIDDSIHGAELVVSDGDGRDELLTAGRRACAPVFLAGPWATVSLVDGKAPAEDGRALAYVCRDHTCKAPVSEPDALIAALEPG